MDFLMLLSTSDPLWPYESAYRYAVNDPLGFVDPSGYQPEWGWDPPWLQPGSPSRNKALSVQESQRRTSRSVQG
jgi:hypothetical protein